MSAGTSHDALVGALHELHAASFGWAMSCCGRRREDAEEALQTAYLRVLSGQARFEGRSSVKTWLFGVIRHVAREQRRKSLLRWLGIGRAEGEASAPASEATQEQQAGDAEQARIVAAGLATLPERQREVLHLVFYEGLTVREAAEVMGVSTGSASQHYERGKRSLAAYLERRGVQR